MRFAAIHVPEFPAVSWSLTLPASDTPLVVLDGQPPREGVLSLCKRARAAGVRRGMSKVQAEAICSGRMQPRDSQVEEKIFTRLCDTAGGYSPRIEAVTSPKNGFGGSIPAVLLLLDASGMGTLFGSDEQYTNRLHQSLLTKRLPAGVSIAPNAEAALMLARSTSRYAVADESTVREQLAVLPVALLPCEPRALGTLNRWGIRTLGQLAALPETELVSRLGQQGRRLQLLARGQAERLLVPEEPTFELSETTQLDTPVELLDSLLFVISPMLEAVLRTAMERAYALRSVRLTLALDGRSPHTVAIQPALPSQDREALLKLLNLALQAKPPQAGILGVTLTAESAHPARAQRGLFQSQFPETDRLDLLLARLRAIAGETNVGAPRLLNAIRDDAFALDNFSPGNVPNAHENGATHGLALRRFRPCPTVRVVCWDGLPKLVFWMGRRLAVKGFAGPWHRSGSWWDTTAYDFDCWDVVVEDPTQALRLQRDCASDVWSLVGVYD